MSQVRKAKAKLQLVGKVRTFLWDAQIVPDYRTVLLLTKNPIYYQALIKKALLQYDNSDNLVVNTGLAGIVDLLLNDSSIRITHCGVGSGTNAVTAADTTLQTEITPRLAVTDGYRVSNNEMHADTFFSTADGNGSWEETGLFSQVNPGGTMWCRKRFAATFTKNISKTATVAWTWTLTAVP